MREAYIYGLKDPRTGLTRYVGKSVDPKARLKDHLRARSNTHCARWIRTLRAIGLKPEIIILEGPCKDWEEAESRWIRLYGSQLTNLTSGGDGLHDLVRTPEHCAAIGRANKGRKATPETRALQSVSQKIRFADPNWLTPEVRIYRSLAAKSRKTVAISPEGRAKIAAARKGSKASAKTREKMRAAHRARFDGPDGLVERQKSANYGAKNGRYGKPYTAPKAACPKCGRIMAVHALPNHLKVCGRPGS